MELEEYLGQCPKDFTVTGEASEQDLQGQAYDVTFTFYINDNQGNTLPVSCKEGMRYDHDMHSEIRQDLEEDVRGLTDLIGQKPARPVPKMLTPSQMRDIVTFFGYGPEVPALKVETQILRQTWAMMEPPLPATLSVPAMRTYGQPRPEDSLRAILDPYEPPLPQVESGL